MRSFLLSLTLLAAVAAPTAARAQDADAAGKHFQAAQEAFGAHRYKTAATEFEAAYGIMKDPAVLYNIGESWERAGDGKQAVANYRQYLRVQPNAPDKARVQERIKAIEAKRYRLVDQSTPDDRVPADTSTAPAAGAGTPPAGAAPAGAAPASGERPAATPPPLPESTAPTSGALTPPSAPAAATPTPEAAQGATPAPEPATTPPPAEPGPPPGLIDEGPPTKLRVAAWIGVAATLALLTAGAIFALAAQSRGDEITRNLSFVNQSGQPNTFDSGTNETLTQLRRDGHLYDALGIGFFSASAASAIATVTLFLVDAKRPKPAAKERAGLRFVPTLGKDGAGFAVGGQF